MRGFMLTSGSIFALVALAQFVRLVFALPVEVGGVTVPVWASVVPLLVAGALATWAFRLATRAERR